MLLKKTYIALALFILIYNSLIFPVHAQDHPIVVTIGRPNIWSLEQAHYLLARMHHTNRNVQADPLNNLNPNEINANQIRLLRQILGISADYAQTKKPPPKEANGETETAENKASLDISLPESEIEIPPNAFSDPKLNASTVLDNYINLQYEIIARQLTLLRDEVGPGERLVFLELPHSVYTTEGKADKRLVQVWWRIEGFSKKNRIAGCTLPLIEQNRDEDDFNNFEPLPTSEIIRIASNARSGNRTDGCREFIRADNAPYTRTIDLIPRQSSLILNKTYDSVSGLNLFGGFSWLFGLGVKGNYQRQKEVFEQYLHQEVYASAFGKGETDFGWTFAPTPGTKRLNPGLRTTYAVIIVPKEAETIALEAKSCYFKQTRNQPNNYNATNSPEWNNPRRDERFCNQTPENFIIPIPNGGDFQGLYVSDIRFYAGQKPGNRIVVSIKGKNFSPQVGVMINGVPLRQSVGIAQPFLDKINSQDEDYKKIDKAFSEKYGISGEVEYVASDEIVFSFSMTSDFKGTPTIHLVGPGRAVYLNELPNVKVNSNPRGGRLKNVEWMFGLRPNSGFAISDFKVFPTNNANRFTGLLIGSNFAPNARVFINGSRNNISNISRVSNQQIRFTFISNSNEEIMATIINGGNDTDDTDSITFRRLSPFILNQVVALSYENNVMVVQIDGVGLSGLKLADFKGADKITVTANGSSQAFLSFEKPKEIVEFILENSSGQRVRSVVVRPIKSK